MLTPLFAMPPPEWLAILHVGFLFVFLIAMLAVTATRNRAKRSEQNRRVGLGVLAIFCGPFVGAFLAWLGNTLGGVHPADVR